MPFALLPLVVAALGGLVLSYRYEDDAPLTARLAYGVTSGTVVLAIGGFAAAVMVGIGGSVVIAAILAGLPLLTLARSDVRARLVDDVRVGARDVAAAIRRPSLSTGLPLVYSGALVALLWLIFDRVILEHDGGISTGYVNNLGDLPFHFQVVSSFAYGQNFPAEDPVYAGTSFAYPYLADFVTALFIQLGATMRQAFFIQNLALGLALVALLHRLTSVLTRDRVAAFVAPLLVLFSGGLGFVTLFEDARRGERGLGAVLGALTHDATLMSEGGYRWGNAVTTLLVTQRSLAFGLPVAVLIFILLRKVISAKHPAGRQAGPVLPRTWPAVTALLRANGPALAAGILTGCLPLIHAHSYVVVLGTAFFLGLLFRQWREGRWLTWALFVLAALVIGLPQILLSTAGSVANAASFFGIEFGWDHLDLNIAWFWFINTGLFIPLSVLAAVWFHRSGPGRRSLLLFSAAFLAWFIVPNVLKLAPWIWDNIKVLFYWFVGFVPLVSLLLATMLRGAKASRSVGLIALLTLTLAGGIDVWRVVSGQTEYGEFDRDGVAIAQLIRRDTEPRALILHAATYNPAVFLTGRRSLLGYPGYIWAHGLSYIDREADIKRMYAGAAGATDLLARYGVDYIVVSPLERGSMTVNDVFIGGMKLVAQAGEYRLYEVAKP